MAIQCLIRANNAQTGKGILKGMVEGVKEEPCEWGTKEDLPDYVRIRIPDATLQQAETFLQPWDNTFEYTIENVVGAEVPTKRIVLSMDAKIIEVLGDGKALKQELRNLLLESWGVNLISHNQSSVTFDVQGDIDLQLMKEQLHDMFYETVAYRIYMFREADVDFAIANGGYVEIQKAQALSRIIDRRE